MVYSKIHHMDQVFSYHIKDNSDHEKEIGNECAEFFSFQELVRKHIGLVRFAEHTFIKIWGTCMCIVLEMTEDCD